MLLARLSVIEEGRLAERRVFSDETTIRISGKPRTVQIVNLSATGCALQTDLPLKPEMQVRIGLRGVGTFDADVIRAADGEFGCQFHTPLRQDQVDLAFTNNVVVGKHWNLTNVLEQEFPNDRSIPARVKLAYIVLISAALWTVIGIAAKALS